MKIDAEPLLKKYLLEGRVMQLATVSSGQPWVCTVYYVADDEMNLYWLSLPARRHSREIAGHSQVAITVPIKFDLPVIGVQAEGTAAIVEDSHQVQLTMEKYTEKYGSGELFYRNFIAGNNKHVMYRFRPRNYVLFDEVNFPEVGSNKISFSG